MKTAKKAILLVLCAALLVTASVMGTLAYLTSTASVTNTMTVGKVEITLDEAKVNEYGVVITGDNAGRIPNATDTATGNAYKLIPGRTYTKDPTIHVAEGSEACWLFVKVENGVKNIEDGNNTVSESDDEDTLYTIEAQMSKNGWTALNGVENVWYHEIVDASTATKDKDVKVFESFTLKGDAEVASYATATISITAYAIQADGFTDANDAWTAGSFN